MVQRTKKQCSIDGCNKTHKSRGYCRSHYERWQRHGNPLAGRPAPQPGGKCSVDSCDGIAKARGYCFKCYQRWQRNGEPVLQEKVIEICAIDDCEEIVDSRGWCRVHYERWVRHGDPEFVVYVKTESPEESFALRTEWQGNCLIWTGSKDKKGYGQISIPGGDAYAHRYAWERVNGPIPDGMFIDHKDHCSTSCVNVDHLRLATAAQNNYHRSGPLKGSKSGIRNVYPSGSKWQVQVRKNGIIHYFGAYDDINEAAQVAEVARENLFGVFAGRG